MCIPFPVPAALPLPLPLFLYYPRSDLFSLSLGIGVLVDPMSPPILVYSWLVGLDKTKDGDRIRPWRQANYLLSFKLLPPPPDCGSTYQRHMPTGRHSSEVVCTSSRIHSPWTLNQTSDTNQWRFAHCMLGFSITRHQSLSWFCSYLYIMTARVRASCGRYDGRPHALNQGFSVAGVEPFIKFHTYYGR